MPLKQSQKVCLTQMRILPSSFNQKEYESSSGESFNSNENVSLTNVAIDIIVLTQHDDDEARMKRNKKLN